MPSIANAVFCTLAIAASTATTIAAFSLSTPSSSSSLATTSMASVVTATADPTSRLTKTLLLAGANGDATARPTTPDDDAAANTNKQSQYGISLEYPSTYVRCGKCGSIYAIEEADLGDRGRGRRMECSTCGNTWFQSRDRLMNLQRGMEMVPLEEEDLKRIEQNKAENRPLTHMGDAKLYVGNISFQCSEQELSDMFASVGTVGEVSMVYDNETGRPRGFAFVTMRTQADGEKAIAELDGTEIHGRPLAVRESTS